MNIEQISNKEKSVPRDRGLTEHCEFDEAFVQSGVTRLKLVGLLKLLGLGESSQRARHLFCIGAVATSESYDEAKKGSQTYCS